MSKDESTQGKGARDSRKLLPLWRITGKVTLRTPLSIGTGLDVKSSEVADSPYVISITRDENDKPYIAGSSFKGALNALAKQVDMATKVRQDIFGSESGGDTTASLVEFCNLYLLKDAVPQPSNLPNVNQFSANIPHVVIDRDYGIAKEGLLFLKQVVPPAYTFEFECTAREISAGDIQALLGLLNCAGEDNSPLRLGSGKAADNGKISWSLKEVRQIEDVNSLLKMAKSAENNSSSVLWKNAKEVKLTATPIQQNSENWLDLGELTLNFHTPFLVYEKQNKNGSDKLPDGKPRQNHKGYGVLPASSLHGALRSQAERILRTVGEETLFGYKVAAVADVTEAKKLDLASVLFGAPGWQSVVRISDFVEVEKKPRITHEMVAIDRITGGGKDGAKFSIEVLDCPTLKGRIQFDLRRLNLLGSEAMQKAIGLLAHLLRDLDESDIPLGYGAAKGYGRSTSAIWHSLEAHLGMDAFKIALTTFSKLAAASTTNNVDSTPNRILQRLEDNAAAPQAFTPQATQGDFHNPYVFIPFGKPKPGSWQDFDSIKDSHHSHARYSPNSFHGRLVCRLTTKTLLFIGAGDVDGTTDPKQKKNFKLDDQIAIPATSLRGMLSSLHESITQSRMRVMHDNTYSMRQTTGGSDANTNASSALGRIRVIDGKVTVEPLTLPTIEGVKEQFIIPERFRFLFPKSEDENGREIHIAFHKVLLEPQRMSVPRDSHYQESRNSNFGDNRSRGYWFIKLKPLMIGRDWSLSGDCRLKQNGNREYLIGQRPCQDSYPISEEEYEKLTSKRDFVRGFLRPMGRDGRQMPPPTVRKYELFVPYPEECDEFEEVTFPCTDVCLNRFEDLAAEQYDLQEKKLPANSWELLPYTPLNQKRSTGTLVPSHGDLVFFKPSLHGKKIEEISYSSIWRARLESNGIASMTANFLPTKDFVPCNNGNLSPAEIMFGKVDAQVAESQINTEDTIKQQAFASKVYFGFGTSPAGKTAQLGEEIPLKILASPKPPSSAMYFQKTAQSIEYISKKELLNRPQDYQLKGRKIYLHQPRNNNATPGQTGNNENLKGNNENLNQKTRIHPIQPNQQFVFTVDFKNLKQEELKALCATLLPHPKYEHKIGMGKPLGLGSVKIEVTEIELIDRVARYRQNSFSNQPRYAKSTIPAANLAEAYMAYLASTAPEIYRAIILSGNPDAVTKPVCYPKANATQGESKLYEWFVQNDLPASTYEGKQQVLGSFTSNSVSIPTLSYPVRPKKPKNIPFKK